MTMRGTSCLRAIPARGSTPANSPTADALRRRIQTALPYGGAVRIAARLGRPERCVHAQVEGEHPLTVSLVVEALRELPEASALAALDELLAPGRLAVYRIGSVPPDGEPLSAVARLAAEIGDVAREALAAFSDGTLSTAERAALLREIDEAASALAHLRATVTGSAA